MKKYNTEAIILKSRGYRDADKIYTFLTPGYGKLSALARGVRKITSRRAGNLDSLNMVKVKITDAGKGFMHIDEVETLESFIQLKKDLRDVVKAYYLLELVDRTIEEGSKDEMIFYLLWRALNMLEKREHPRDIIVFYFELNFLRLLGYSPPLPAKMYSICSMNDTFVKWADKRVKKLIYEYLSGKFKSLEIL